MSGSCRLQTPENFGFVIGWVVEDGGVVSSRSCCFCWEEEAVLLGAFACVVDLESAHSVGVICGLEGGYFSY